MWVSSILIVICYIMKQVEVNWDSIVTPILYALYLVAGIGLGAFQANIIQFGIDQLPDASSMEISSFIVWYSWMMFSSKAPFLMLETVSNSIYRALFVATCLSLALCLDLLFNQWLIKEPIARNPFKLIFEVIKYMIKHKQPQQRSAFTYCEDEIVTRIDFGKIKYGGPFTTEQVEDVKTFFRMLVVLSIGSTVGLVSAVAEYPRAKLNKHLQDNDGREWYKTFHFGYIFVICVTGPAYDFLLHPLLEKCRLRMNFNYAKKFVTAACLCLLYLTILMIIEGSVQHIPTLEQSGSCIFTDKNFTISVNYQWSKLITLPNFIASFLFVLGALEFICSQSPYSMKGILLGMCYSLIGFNVVIQGLITLPFSLHSISWKDVPLHCGFWYFLLQALIIMIFGLSFIVVVKCIYKKRRREDVLPNEHMFAIQYYERYTSFSSSSLSESDIQRDE